MDEYDDEAEDEGSSSDLCSLSSVICTQNPERISIIKLVLTVMVDSRKK